MRSAGFALGLALMAIPALASAQTQLLVGSKLVIKNPRQGDEANKMVFMSKDLSVASPASMEENPRCMPYGSGSASLTVTSTSGESFTLDLGGAKCVNWKGNVAGTRWKYRDTSGTTCNVILIKSGVLQKIVCHGPQVAFALGAVQDSIDIVLSTGTSPRRWCTTFNDGAQDCVVKKDGSDGRRYVALDCASPAASCGGDE